MSTNLSELRSYLNRALRLSFKDGEVVEATLLGVDLELDRDLTYEIRRILAQGSPPPRGTAVGATCIASLDDLDVWEPVSDGQAAV
jgi:hypothetical protein